MLSPADFSCTGEMTMGNVEPHCKRVPGALVPDLAIKPFPLLRLDRKTASPAPALHLSLGQGSSAWLIMQAVALSTWQAKEGAAFLQSWSLCSAHA